MKHSALNREDYEEPCCPLDMTPEVSRIAIGRVIEKLDSYLDHHDYDAAERHLKYWVTEAETGHDDRGKLSLLNEQVGLYRKLGKKEEGLAAIENLLKLAEKLEIGNTVSQGTTLINAATAYKSFGMVDQAMPLYYNAQVIYEALLSPEDYKMGGLYNNMAIALCEKGEFACAREFFDWAMAIMEKQEHAEGEAAVTCLNKADLVYAENGHDGEAAEIEALLEQAEKLLDTPDLPQNGDHAFYCEKCAPVFGYYGWFMAEEKYRERARKIYEGA